MRSFRCGKEECERDAGNLPLSCGLLTRELRLSGDCAHVDVKPEAQLVSWQLCHNVSPPLHTSHFWNSLEEGGRMSKREESTMATEGNTRLIAHSWWAAKYALQ